MEDTWDPWKAIIGNSRVLESLRRVAGSPSLGHAYIFQGPEGIGKLLASLAFAREINCRCGDGSPGEIGDVAQCESCRSLDVLNHPEVLLICDAIKTRWLVRRDLVGKLGLEGEDSRARYAETVVAIYEKGYLEDPLPRVEVDAAIDGFNLVTEHLFGRGSVPSRECYTPAPVSDAIRKAFDRGNLSQAEFALLRELYELPLSVMPYRGTIHLAYVTPRKDWKYTRPIQAFLSVRSMLGGKKVVIVDDAHKMTEAAQNCLLKTLEEPPPDSLIILVTSDKRALFPTIVSRCQVISFERLTRGEMELAASRLVGAKTSELTLLAALSENCPGKLLEAVSTGVVGTLAAVRDLFNALGCGRVEGVFAFSSAVMPEASHRKKAQTVLRHALGLLVFWIAQIVRAKRGVDTDIQLPQYTAALQEQARQFDEDLLLDAAKSIEKSLGLARLNVDLGLLLVTTLLRVAETLKAEGTAPTRAR